jgi:chromosome partitioning protein
MSNEKLVCDFGESAQVESARNNCVEFLTAGQWSALMTYENTSCAPCVRVIAVANEKGGSGKSTVGIHIAIALMRMGQSVATLDLDWRQRTLTHYIDNRLAWARQRGKELPTPTHVCFDEEAEFLTAENEAAGRAAFADTLQNLAGSHGYLVIDTPGHNHYLSRLAHMVADTLITPLNDSFVDLDVLGSVDPETFSINGVSHYARVVEEARRERQIAGKPDIDWIVLRNRLSSLTSRNKRFVGDALQDLSQKLGFRCIEGLAERVIFREFYPRGLTAVDDLDNVTLGTRPTMSHVTAQLEVQQLIAALLGAPAQADESASPVGEATAQADAA